MFLDLGLMYFFFLQFWYFPNIYLLFTRQALIEGFRSDYPAYTTTLLVQSPCSHNYLACIIAQLTRLPSSQDCLAPTSTILAQLPSSHNHLAYRIAQLPQAPCSHNYLARIITQLIGLASSHKHPAYTITQLV